MIFLLGATGYVGEAFGRVLTERSIPFVSLAKPAFDCSSFDALLRVLRDRRPEFVINAAGHTGRPNVDACEVERADTVQGNVLLPMTIAHACHVAGVPWGHVSSGCIYTGAKISENGSLRVEKNLNRPEIRRLIESARSAIRGFCEDDAPNFSFRNGPCSFYSGTKALGEEAILGVGQAYVWRLRIPFDEVDGPRNFLTKVQTYTKVYDNYNSLSHLTDFVHACVELWLRGAPYGIYNVTNPGFVSTRQVVQMVQKILKPKRSFEFWENDEEFYKHGAKTPRSNCILDSSKLVSAGVSMRPVESAIEAALCAWKRAQ